MLNALLMYNVSFDHKSTAQYMILLVICDCEWAFNVSVYKTTTRDGSNPLPWQVRPWARPQAYGTIFFRGGGGGGWGLLPENQMVLPEYCLFVFFTWGGGGGAGWLPEKGHLKNYRAAPPPPPPSPPRTPVGKALHILFLVPWGGFKASI